MENDDVELAGYASVYPLYVCLAFNNALFLLPLLTGSDGRWSYNLHQHARYHDKSHLLILIFKLWYQLDFWSGWITKLLSLKTQFTRYTAKRFAFQGLHLSVQFPEMGKILNFNRTYSHSFIEIAFDKRKGRIKTNMHWLHGRSHLKWASEGLNLKLSWLN